MPQDLNKLLQPSPDCVRHMRLGSDDAVGLGLHRGDLLLIDTSIEPKFGDVVVASIDGRWRVRLLQRMSGRIILTAKTFTTADTHYEVWAQLDILGVVVYSVHPHGKTMYRKRLWSVRPSVAPHQGSAWVGNNESGRNQGN